MYYIILHKLKLWGNKNYKIAAQERTDYGMTTEFLDPTQIVSYDLGGVDISTINIFPITIKPKSSKTIYLPSKIVDKIFQDNKTTMYVLFNSEKIIRTSIKHINNGSMV